MLVLSRKAQESIIIGNEITVTVLRICGGQVRLGIDADGKYRIVRAELRSQTPPDSVAPDSRTAPAQP